MKIYAVKDRLIDYYMQPFAAPSDKAVMAAIANQVNNQEDQNAIAQAPHHFEIWRLGEVKENGSIEAGKEFLCDCAQLVRTGIRGNPNRNPVDPPSAGRTSTQGGHPGAATANTRPAENPAPAAPGAD